MTIFVCFQNITAAQNQQLKHHKCAVFPTVCRTSLMNVVFNFLQLQALPPGARCKMAGPDGAASHEIVVKNQSPRSVPMSDV